MRIEKWIYEGKEIEVPIFEKDEIEKNEDLASKDINAKDEEEKSE